MTIFQDVRRFFYRRYERRELTYQALSALGTSTDIAVWAAMLKHLDTYPEHAGIRDVVDSDLNALVNKGRVRRLAENDMYEVVA